MGERERYLRLDEALVAAGLSPSRSRARDQVLRGCVSVDGRVETKPSRKVPADAKLALEDDASSYVSRSALKLIAGLEAAAFDVTGVRALDVGASTGGFTQVLLERAASNVLALDVGRDQLVAELRDDPRVGVMEGINARDLEPGDLPWPPDFVAVDVSFISLTLILPAVLALAGPGARGVFLFKPQFEVGRDGIGKGGIVRADADVDAAFDAVCRAIVEAGWRVVATCDAPIAGGDGNRERLIAAAASTSHPA
ncbi:TlyA family RNA methyltransferase [Tepidamorphus sp. 3E244]|uniref:TlyA family RNA methyltransferase n=1 Tax=Tepidamorphus sp. 3E244 TaxID=3385498 RepID=UPI0038FCB076